jgi:creatinine amidohydrolase
MTSLAQLSWVQVQEALDAGRRTVLFAAGSTEQHGPHLPLATDTMLGDALADRVAARLPGVLRGPTLSLGVSPHHMGFPGTITLSPQTFQAVVREYVGSLGAHGFETVLVIPSHGGNFAPLRELHTETGGEIGGARFVPYTDLLEFVDVMTAVGRADGLPPEVSGSHAGEAETSILLALDQGLVAMDKAVAGYDKPLDEEVAARLFAAGTKALSEYGVLGDARPATAERGRRYLDALVDLLITYFDAWCSPR